METTISPTLENEVFIMCIEKEATGLSCQFVLQRKLSVMLSLPRKFVNITPGMNSRQIVLSLFSKMVILKVLIEHSIKVIPFFLTASSCSQEHVLLQMQVIKK